jgi:predicted transcriptional regulator
MQHTTKTSTITIRVDRVTKERLEHAAKLQNRNKSFIATEAIEQLLAVYDAQDAQVREALESLDTEGGIPHEKVKAWVESWGTDNELPRPTL